ncbi:hypothetical protein IFVP5_C290450 [Vibrio parahaemolyticus]
MGGDVNEALEREKTQLSEMRLTKQGLIYC